MSGVAFEATNVVTVTLTGTGATLQNALPALTVPCAGTRRACAAGLKSRRFEAPRNQFDLVFLCLKANVKLLSKYSPNDRKFNKEK